MHAGDSELQRGFSIMEVMVVVVIVGVLTAIAIPAFSSWKERQAVSNVASSLLMHLKQARNLAVAENRSVSITFSSSAYTVDADTTGSCGPCKDNAVSYSQFSGGLSISPTTTRTFSSRGTLDVSTDITLSASGNSKVIEMNVMGRAFVQ